MNRAKFTEFADDMETLLERKADASKTVSEALKGYCEMEENQGVEKKNIRKLVKDYIRWKKEGQKVVNENNEYDLLFNMVIGEIDNSI